MISPDTIHLRSEARQEVGETWKIVSGEEQLKSLQPELAGLCERCGQAGALDHLEYFLSVPFLGIRHAVGSSSRLSKVPRTLLLRRGEELVAAVLMAEYLLLGVPTGLFIPIDSDGQRSVIAPVSSRRLRAHQAGDFVMRNGGRVALVSWLVEGERTGEFVSASAFDDNVAAPASNSNLLGRQSRDLPRRLPLRATFDQTLAQMGAHTRRDLRAFRRRAIKELGAVYVHRAELSKAEFLAMNRDSMYAVPEWVAEWRYASARSVAGGIFSGMISGDGRWLSIIGGHKSLDAANLDWQVNLAGFGSLSLVTAMRSFFIEDQIQQGLNWLRFDGGTPHVMSSAFVLDRAYDLLFAKTAIPRKFLMRLAVKGYVGEALSRAITSTSMEWLR